MSENLNLKNIKAIEFRYYKNFNHVLTQLMKIDLESIKENKNFTHIIKIPDIFINENTSSVKSLIQNIKIRFIFNEEYEELIINKELINFIKKYDINKIEKALKIMKEKNGDCNNE